MLNKIKNRENVIMIFFVVTLFGVGIFAFFGREFIDVIYFVVMLYYFFRFLKIKNS